MGKRGQKSTQAQQNSSNMGAALIKHTPQELKHIL